MAIDKCVAERRRFARLLGTDGELGSGLPIGVHPTPSEEETETDEERLER